MFVYILTEIPPTGLVKVGVTQHSPYKRRSNLQTGNPRPLDLVCWIGVKDADDAFAIEKDIISTTRYFEQRAELDSPEGEWIHGSADYEWWCESLLLSARAIGAEIEGVSA